MLDEWFKFLTAAALVSYITDTLLTIVWKVFGNGRFK